MITLEPAIGVLVVSLPGDKRTGPYHYLHSVEGIGKRMVIQANNEEEADSRVRALISMRYTSK